MLAQGIGQRHGLTANRPANAAGDDNPSTIVSSQMLKIISVCASGRYPLLDLCQDHPKPSPPAERYERLPQLVAVSRVGRRIGKKNRALRSLLDTPGRRP